MRMWQDLQTGRCHQVGDGRVERLCDFRQVKQPGILFPTFNRAYVGTIYHASMGQFFLGNPRILPRRAHGGSKRDERGIFGVGRRNWH